MYVVNIFRKNKIFKKNRKRDFIVRGVEEISLHHQHFPLTNESYISLVIRWYTVHSHNQFNALSFSKIANQLKRRSRAAERV